VGNHGRVRRIKIINWGRKSSGPDGFVVSMITADPASGVSGVIETGIEECIAIQPDTGTSSPVTVFHAGPKDDTGTNAEGFGTGPFIRNCFVDCVALTNPLSFDIRGLSMAWCKGGTVDGNQVHNTKYGGPCIGRSSSRDFVVRNNFYKNVAKGPYWNLATMSVASLATLVRDTDHTTEAAGAGAAADCSTWFMTISHRVLSPRAVGSGAWAARPMAPERQARRE
jgi:hypothetical protein